VSDHPRHPHTAALRRGRFALTRVMSLAACCLLAACSAPRPEIVHQPDPKPTSLLLRHAGVLDVGGGRVLADRDVLVRGDRIAAIGLGGQIAAEPGVREIDAGGATLLPGLIDVHGHVSLDSAPTWVRRMPDVEANLRSYLYTGVTTVLDPSDATPEAAERRDQIARGELLGPHLYTAGRLLTAHGGHPVALLQVAAPWWIRWYLVPGAAHQVGTPEEARAAVALEADAGVDFIKVVVDRIPEEAALMDDETLRAAVEAADARGLRTLAHIGSVRDALATGRAGVAAWVHNVYKERIPDATITELADFGIPMVPTLVVWHSYADIGGGGRIATRLERETESVDVLDAFNDDPDASALAAAFAPYLEMLRDQRPIWAENVQRLHAAGVTILAGSDTQSGVLPGPGLHRELALLHAAGLSRAETIRAATLHAARFVSGQQDPDFGLIEVGKRADLLLVEGNPLDDLDALSNIREVIVSGVPLERMPIGAATASGG